METTLATGRPDILLFRKSTPALFSAERVDEERAQYEALNAFWLRGMRDERGHFHSSFKMFATPDDFIETVVQDLRGWLGERLKSAAWQRGSPFRGLSAFDVEHAPIFFGRERAIAEMGARLAASAQATDPSPLLLVVGPSGSGKSSVVRAGLIPDLVHRHRAPGIDPWRYTVPAAIDPRKRSGRRRPRPVETPPGASANSGRGTLPLARSRRGLMPPKQSAPRDDRIVGTRQNWIKRRSPACAVSLRLAG